MMFRSLAALLALATSTPAFAQQPAAASASPDALHQQVGLFAGRTNEERMEAALGLIRLHGFEPEVESFAGGNRSTGELQGRNIVFTVGQGDREILLTAHYDAVVLPDGSLSQGVVDNAASVVGVIEAARLLQGRELGHRVRVILFDQEELGLIGARRWIEAHGLQDVAAVVNSDVAAYGDTLMYGLNNGPQSAGAVRAVREVCAERALNCVAFPVYPPSDDRVFSGAGLGDGRSAAAVVPTVSLGFQDHLGAHQMWLAFNGGENSGLAEGFIPQVFRLIHSHEDTMDHVDPATIRLAAETYASVVERLDRQLRR